MRRADLDDRDGIIALIDAAADWLRDKGTDQWRRPWPSRPERDARVERGIEQRKTWLVHDGSALVATLTVYESHAVDLLSPGADARRGTTGLWEGFPGAEDPAFYIYRFVRARDYDGPSLGGVLLDLFAARAARSMARWLRVDVWTTNTALHDYYRGHGFEYVGEVPDSRLREIDLEGCPSAALFQRNVRADRLDALSLVPAQRRDGRPRAVYLVD